MVSSALDGINSYDSGNFWIYIHAGLMLGAWCFFIPIGILIARHKHIFHERKFLGIHVWFHTHRLCQIMGIGACVSSIVIAFLKLGIPDKKIGHAHYIIGITVIGMTGAQTLSLLVKPVKHHTFRSVWNMFHRINGLLTTIFAWCNIYIGIYCFHNQTNENYTRWILPAAGSTLCILIADRIMSSSRKRCVNSDVNSNTTIEIH